MEQDNVKLLNKYKKHKALVLLGLKSQEELNRDLTRFDSQNIEKIKETVLEKIKAAKVPTSYLLSLIPRYDYHSLPNCIVSSEADFSLLEDLLTTFPEAVEVWAFPKERDALIGRFALQTDSTDLGQYQILEQVWSTNHRDIDRYDPRGKIPFISASRPRWMQGYRMDRVQNIPDDDKEKYVRQFVNAAVEIENRREKIEEIAEYFKGLGIESFSLEYRLDSKGFSFIDWDTNKDDKVLIDLFPKTNENEKRIENDAR